MGEQRELEILGYLNENRFARAPDHRKWIPMKTKPIEQLDTYIPLGPMEGYHKIVLGEIADYLKKNLGIEFHDDDLAQIGSKKFVAKPTSQEVDLRNSIYYPEGSTHIPYQIFFHAEDAQKVKAYVAKRLQELHTQNPSSQPLPLDEVIHIAEGRPAAPARNESLFQTP